MRMRKAKASLYPPRLGHQGHQHDFQQPEEKASDGGPHDIADASQHGSHKGLQPGMIPM